MNQFNVGSFFDLNWWMILIGGNLKSFVSVRN